MRELRCTEIGSVVDPVMVLPLVLLILPVDLPAQTDPDTEEHGEDEVYVQFLVRKARQGTVPERILAMEEISQIGFSTLFPPLKEAVSDPDTRLRMAAVRAVGRMPHAQETGLLKQALFDEHPMTGTAALEQITKRTPDVFVPLLIDGLSHSSARVRSLCHTRLRRWTGYSFGYNPTSNSDERGRAVERWREWWSKHREQSPEQWWVDRLRTVEEHPVNVAPIIGTISQLVERKSWSAVPRLIELLDHGRMPVRVHALDGVRTITEQRFDFTSDPPGEVAERMRGEWLAWWKGTGATDRLEWLVPHLKTLVNKKENRRQRERVNRITTELVEADRKNTLSRVAPLLMGTRDERRVGVEILERRTGLQFRGAEDRGAKNKRDRFVKQVRSWRRWIDRWAERSKSEWMMHVLKVSEFVKNRKTAAEYLRSVRRKEVVQVLINHGLTDQAEKVREASIEALKRLTGRRLDYRAEAPTPERETRISIWREWWSEQDRFFERRGF